MMVDKEKLFPLADKSGLRVVRSGLALEIVDSDGICLTDEFMAFAALVMAAERERCARIVERINGWAGTREMAAEIRGETQILKVYDEGRDDGYEEGFEDGKNST